VIGAGATGLPAAIVACEAGCSVILVEAESDIGGHAIISGGNVPLGGGTSVQKKYGIADSPDLLFRDLTDWSVVGPNGFAAAGRLQAVAMADGPDAGGRAGWCPDEPAARARQSEGLEKFRRAVRQIARG
jgi:hypothetical protein